MEENVLRKKWKDFVEENFPNTIQKDATIVPVPAGALDYTRFCEREYDKLLSDIQKRLSCRVCNGTGYASYISLEDAIAQRSEDLHKCPKCNVNSSIP